MNIQTKIADHIYTISYVSLQFLTQIIFSSESKQDYFDDVIMSSM
jgi:hypothetical protein